MAKAPLLGREQAVTLGLRALAFLAGDDERLDRFLALTGLDPASLSAMARDESCAGPVLEHLAQDESLLLAFAANENISPETVMRACHLLNPVFDGGA